MPSALPTWAAAAPVARLATCDGNHPHLVPVVFWAQADAVYVPIDGKPKTGRRLKRVANIEANPAVSLLVDEYRDDWRALRWARIDGDAAVVATEPHVATALRAKYPQYEHVDVGVQAIRIAIARVAVWADDPRPGRMQRLDSPSSSR